MMWDRETIFEAFRNCTTEPKCQDCPWVSCEVLSNRKIEIPADLCLDVIELMKEGLETRKNYIRLLAELEPVKPIVNKGNLLTRCGKCGHWLLSSFRHCPECGREVKKDEQDSTQS